MKYQNILKKRSTVISLVFEIDSLRGNFLTTSLRYACSQLLQILNGFSVLFFWISLVQTKLIKKTLHFFAVV